MLLEFNCRNIVFAQDQVSEYKAPDDLVSMSWDLLIPEGWQGSGLTGGKGSLTPPLHLGQDRHKIGRAHV